MRSTRRNAVYDHETDTERFSLEDLDPPYVFTRRQPALVSLGELWDAMLNVDEALNGDSNDAEHDVLYALRQRLSEWFERGA